LSEPAPKRIRLFTPDREGTFLRRPNRFILEAGDESGVIRAHCPNPGRMEEYLLPGSRFVFESAEGTGRKTAWSLAAVRYRGMYIPLHSARANRAAAELILPALYPSSSIRPEATEGGSRFDFLVTSGPRRTWVEVKACTLVEHGTAMFPDAPTQRGLRHIEHLTRLSDRPDTKAMLLFVVMNPEAKRFVPNIHTDPAFSLALAGAEKMVNVRAVSLYTDGNGFSSISNMDIPVETAPVSAARDDTGVYLLVLELPQARSTVVGALGRIDFRPGWYVYAGSGKKNLSARVARHLRTGKALHWHVDYLVAQAGKKKAYPIRTHGDLECRLAGDIAGIADASVPGFGCSDCRCPSHLFYFRKNPPEQSAFQDVLLRYRHEISIGEYFRSVVSEDRGGGPARPAGGQ